MKHLLVALLLAVVTTSALADSPEAILKDYRKQAAQAVERLNQSLEKAATPIITRMVKDGDTSGAELLTSQVKDKLAGEPVPTPQASAVQLFSLYDDARAKALAPLQKSSISRIDSLLKTAGGAKLDLVAELGKVREEIEAGNSPSMANDGGIKTSATGGKKVAEVVKTLGGEYTENTSGAVVKFQSVTLSASDLQQICANKRLFDFSWNGGRGLTDEGLAAFEGQKNLDNLFLWSAGSITDAGVLHLAGCEKLRTLSIGANGPGVTGSSFEALAQCKKLESLTLNLLSGVQGPNLRHLIKARSLVHLSLSGCKEVKDADLDLVAQISNLTSLNLGSTGVTNAGISKLLPLKRLKELTVSPPLVTQEGVAELTKVRRDVRVIFVK